MNEAVNVVLQANERTEAGELRDIASDQIANLVILVDIRPWIFGELFHAECNALVALVDLQHSRFHFLALLQDFGWMIDLARPRNVRHVDHTVDALLEFNESTVTR